jgi:chromosome segregation protein
VAVVVSGYLIFAVNTLDQKYGRIVEDFDFYTEQLATTRDRVQLTREDLSELSDQRADLSEQLAQAEGSQRSATQQANDALARRDAAQNELTQLQERLSDAQAIIENAERLRAAVILADGTKNRLESQGIALRADIVDLEAEQRDSIVQRDRIGADIDRLGPQREVLQRDVNSLSQANANLSATQARVGRLMRDEARITASIAGLSESEEAARLSLVRTQEELAGLATSISARREESVALTARVEDLRGVVAALEDQQQSTSVDVADKRARATEFGSRADLSQARLADLSQSEEAARISLARTREELVGVEISISARDEEFVALTARVEDLRGVVAALEAQQRSISADVAGKRIQATEFESRADLSQARFAEFSGQLIATTAALDSAQTEFSTLREQIATMTAQLENKEADFARLSAIQLQAANLIIEVEALDVRKITLEEHLLILATDVQETQRQAAAARTDLERIEQQRAEITALVLALEAEEERLSSRRVSLELAIEEAQSGAEAAQGIRQNLQVEEVRLRAQVGELGTLQDDLEAQVKRLIESLSQFGIDHR